MDATFEDFVLARGEALLRFALMLCADRGRSEDLVQSVLARVYPRWARILVMERPEAYVKTMLVREHLRWWRRRSSTEVPVAEPAGQNRAVVADAAVEYARREAAWELLGRLPRRQRAVLVLRYYEDLSDAAFARRLNVISAVEVVEACDGDRVLTGRVLIAPGGQHMTVERHGAQYRVQVRKGPPVNRHCPSVDVMLRSVARHVGPNALGVIMTGMGDDGARGLLEMRRAGARTIAQDEATCVVYGMPKVATELGAVERELPLSAIPGAIRQFGAEPAGRSATSGGTR